MGFLDTFSRKFGFTTDEEENVMDEEENEIDDEDEEEETLFSFRFPSNPFTRKQTGRTSKGRYNEEDDSDEPEEPRHSPKRSNVIRDPRMSTRDDEAQYTHCERIIAVRQIEECREIIKYLLQGESVLLNLENVDPKDCGRVVDLLSGAAFALQGKMLKIAHLSYLLAPENVEVVKEHLYVDNQERYRG